MTINKSTRCLLAAATALTLATGSAQAQGFYQGKNVNIIINLGSTLR